MRRRSKPKVRSAVPFPPTRVQRDHRQELRQAELTAEFEDGLQVARLERRLSALERGLERAQDGGRSREATLLSLEADAIRQELRDLLDDEPRGFIEKPPGVIGEDPPCLNTRGSQKRPPRCREDPPVHVDSPRVEPRQDWTVPLQQLRQRLDNDETGKAQ